MEKRLLFSSELPHSNPNLFLPLLQEGPVSVLVNDPTSASSSRYKHANVAGS